MSKLFNSVLAGATVEQLSEELRQAAEATDRSQYAIQLAWPLPDLDVLLATFRLQREGRHLWAPEPPRGSARAAVACVWWTDWLGRRHVRVAGDALWYSGAHPWEEILGPGAESAPALALVYPASSFVRLRDGAEQWRVLCPGCGSAGPPEQLAWLGTCCGICHDRREADDDPAGLPADRTQTLTGLRGQVSSLEFSPDGKLLAGAVIGSPVSVWEVGTERRVLSKVGTFRGHQVAFGPEGALAVGGTGADFIALFDPRSGEERRRIPAPGWRTGSLVFSPDGRFLATRLPSGLALLALPEGRPRTLADSPSTPMEMAFSADGQLLACVDAGGIVGVWDTGSGNRVSLTDGTHRIAFVPGSGLLAQAVLRSGAASILLAPAEGRSRPQFALDTELPGLLGLAFSGDGKALLTGDAGTVQMWDVPGRKMVGSVRIHNGPINCLALSPDGDLAATGHRDGSVRLWPAAVWRCE